MNICAHVTPAPTGRVESWVIFSLNAARLLRSFKSVYSVFERLASKYLVKTFEKVDGTYRPIQNDIIYDAQVII